MAKIHPFESKGTLSVSCGIRRIKRNTPCVKRKHWMDEGCSWVWGWPRSFIGKGNASQNVLYRFTENGVSSGRVENGQAPTAWQRSGLMNSGSFFEKQPSSTCCVRWWRTFHWTVRGRQRGRAAQRVAMERKKDKSGYEWDERFFTIFQDSPHRWFTVDQIFFFSYLIALDEVRRCFPIVSGLRALRFDRSKKRNIDWRINGPWSRKYYYIIWESQLRGFIRANSEFHG